MATIATVKGKTRLQFTFARKRRTLYLGDLPKKAAQTIRAHVEHLVNAAESRSPVPTETARWVGELGDDLHAKLAGVGLVPARLSARTVPEFVTEWLAGKEAAGYKPTSLLAWGQTVAELSAHFKGRPLPSLTHADGEAFRDRMRGRRLRPTTIHKRVSHAKNMLEDAVRAGLIPANPFRHVQQRQGDPSERRKYVPVADAQRVIDHCPNVWWKLIVALTRFGGLRMPSEVFSLTWGDVDWERSRLSVTSPKTEHAGKTHRVIPLFSLIRPHLEAAFDAAAEGDVFIMPERYRKRALGKRGWNGANLRTHMAKIVRKAKVDPWPRVFHSLRASHESDLAQNFPLATVTKWLGNTPSVALRHYVDPTDSEFVKASDWTPATGNAHATQKATQTGADTKRPEATPLAEPLVIQAFRRILACPDVYCPDEQREWMGIEPTGSLVQTPRRF